MTARTVACTIERRLLVNYRIEPALVARLLPRPFRPQLGVYVPRRDTNSRITAAAGGTVFPGSYRLARFEVDEPGGQVRINVTSRDGQVKLAVTAAPAGALTSELFETLDDAVDFFRRGALGFSPSAHASCLDCVRLQSASWAAQPMRAEIRSGLFDDTALFPPGTCSLDCALVMRNLPARWATGHPLTSAQTPGDGQARR